MPAATLDRGRSPLAEVRHLRGQLAAAAAERDRLAALIAAHLAADPLERLTAQWAARATESYQAGRTDAAADERARWTDYPPLRPAGGPDAAELEARRWAVRGELRTRGTFAYPHPDDHPGTDTVL
jgi:hypothetical protein